MAATIEDTFTTLLTLSQPDDQASIQGVTLTHFYDAFATTSKISFFDVQAYKLSLEHDTRTINQMEALLSESDAMLAMVYSYRQCSNALPKMLDITADMATGLYKESFDILGSEVSKLRDLCHWHLKACDLVASDLGWYWRGASGPSWTHMWRLVKILDSMLLIDHLKNEKPSLTNDMAVYLRTLPIFGSSKSLNRGEDSSLEEFLSISWSVLTTLKARVIQTPNSEDLTVQLVGFCLENLDLRHTLIWQERMALLRALTVLLVLLTPTEKEGEAVFKKKLKLDKILYYYKREPVLVGYQDSYIIPGLILLELSPFFRKLQLEGKIDMPLGKTVEVGELYNLIPNFSAIFRTHEEVVLRFTTGMSKVWHIRHAWEKSRENPRAEPFSSVNRFGKELRDFVLSALMDCVLFCSKLTERIAQHFAWKLAHPLPLEEAKSRGSAERTPEHGPISGYEQALIYNLSQSEKAALVKVMELIRGVSGMVLKSHEILHEVVWEAVHGEIQEFVGGTLTNLLKKNTKKPANNLAGVLYHLRAVSLDTMKNLVKSSENSIGKSKKDKQWTTSLSSSSSDLSLNNETLARPVPPTVAQLHCMQHLVHILLLGSASVAKGGLFFDRDLSTTEIRELHLYLHRLLIFPSLLDFPGTMVQVTDFSFLWLRELYMERENVIQFPVESSLPWVLSEATFEEIRKGNFRSFSTALIPFTIYLDSYNSALHSIKQKFIVNEIEAEADLTLDCLSEKLSLAVFTYFKQRAASNLLDSSFIENVDKMRRPQLRPPFLQFGTLFEQTHLQVLGRVVDLRAILIQRIEELIRKNLDYIFESMETVDFCAFWETKQLVDVLAETHSLLSEKLTLNPFESLMAESQNSLSLYSFASKVVTYVFRELSSDLLPNFSWSTATLRFVRGPRDTQRPLKRPIISNPKDYFLYGSKDLNRAFSYMAIVHSQFVGLPHIQRMVSLLGSHSLPLIIHQTLILLTDQIDILVGCVENISMLLPFKFTFPPFELGFKGCLDYFQNHVLQLSKSPMLSETVIVLRDIGSLLGFLSLLDIALKHSETSQLLQAAPWLGVVSGQESQLQQLPALTEGEEPSNVPAAPLSDLCHLAAMSAPDGARASLVGLLQGAQVAEAMYWAGVHGESILVHTFASLSAALGPHLAVLSPVLEGVDGASSDRSMLEFHSLYSALEFALCCSNSKTTISTLVEVDNDSIIWGGCAIIYLLGQSKRFELNSFVDHMLRVVEFEETQPQDAELFLNRALKTKRLHSHVFSLVKSHMT